MSRGRVTFVIASLVGGGAERKTVTLTSELAARGWRVSLLSAHPDRDVYPVDPSVHRVEPPAQVRERPPWTNLAAQRQRIASLRRTLLSTHPDVVVGVIDASAVAAIVALRGTGVPVVVFESENPRYQPRVPPWPWLRRITYPRADRVVVLTSDAEEWVRQHRPKWRVTTIPPPVRVPTAVMPRRPQWFGPHNLVTMGRLVPVKGFDLLLEAMARVAPACPQWHLTILGTGPQRPDLESSVERLGLTGRVHLPGFVKEPFPILAAADLYVCSSRNEPLGVAIAEALLSGLPVVSFDCPSGPRELIRDEVDGILVPPGDVGAMADAVRELATNPDRRAGMALAAPQVAEKVGVEPVVDAWERELEAILVAETAARPQM